MAKIKMLAITAPSGGGKGTCVQILLSKAPEKFCFSVSCTTRKRAKGEIDGEDYFFISREDFLKKIKEGYFLEFEEVSGNFYGTPKFQLEEAEKTGKVLLLDVDVKGAERLKDLFGSDICLTFIDSGDFLNVYEKRIKNRKRECDTPESIAKRVSRIPEEISIGRNFQIILHNRGTKETFERLVEDTLIRYLRIN